MVGNHRVQQRRKPVNISEVTYNPAPENPEEKRGGWKQSKWRDFFESIYQQHPDEWVQLDGVFDLNDYTQVNSGRKRWSTDDRPFDIDFTSKAVRNDSAPDGHTTYGFISLKVSRKEEN
jgi:hypothetical protein